MTLPACDAGRTGAASSPGPARTSAPPPANELREPRTLEEAAACREDGDCVLVPFDHCCGPQQRAVNARWKELYLARKDWNTFDDPQLCARIGACADTRDREIARCTGQRCTVERAETAPPPR